MQLRSWRRQRESWDRAGRAGCLVACMASALLAAAGCSRSGTQASPTPPPSSAPSPKSAPRGPGGDSPPDLEARTATVLHAIDVGTGLAIFIEGPDFALLY